MRHPAMTLILALTIAAPALAGNEADFDWDLWRHLPVQDGGRQKPLDTLSWESMRMLSNRVRFSDPKTGKKLDATAMYLALVFDWQGWDRPVNPHSLGDPHGGQAAIQPDRWDQMPLLLVELLELRKALKMSADAKYIAPVVLSKAKIRDPRTGQEKPFVLWADEAVQRSRESRSLLEQKGLELADRLWVYQDLRAGRRLELIPLQGSEDQEWISLGYLTQAPLDDKIDPTGQIRKAKESFHKARAAFRKDSAKEFNQASAAFLATLQDIGPKLGAYPTPAAIDLEIAYNDWVPFRFAWVLTLLALLGALLAMGTGWKSFYGAALTAQVGGLVAMTIGFVMRTAISGRAPVTNMYESVVYVAMGAALFGLIFELLTRRKQVLATAAAVATLALILADNCPAHLDPSLRPLQPVLRNNFWLVTHVLTITLSYAAFALAMGLANITLGYHCLRKPNHEAIEALSRFTYKVLQVGVVLLAAGTILGGVWADYSWGRFWGWDPKEVWALIALLGYLALLHARYVNWIRSFGLAASSILCFFLVIVAWYGVNFVLGAGLHSYGFGGGGQGYVAAALLAQLLYLGFAAIRARPWQTSGNDRLPPGDHTEPHRRHAKPEESLVV